MHRVRLIRLAASLLCACGATDQAVEPTDNAAGQAAQAPMEYAFLAVREGHLPCWVC